MRNSVLICGKEIRVTGRFIKTARLEGEKYEFLEDPESVIRSLPKCGQRVDLFTFLQRLPNTSPVHKYPMEWDNFAAMRVTSFDHWWNEQIGKKTRNMVRQSEKKGIVVREVNLDEAFIKGVQAVYDESPLRQGVPNSHYGKTFEWVFRSTATFLDSSIFIGAYLDDTLVGFVKLVHDETRTQAGMMQIESMVGQRDKAPTNALIAQAVRSCADRQISYLVYSNFAYGGKQRSSLSDFKERNGFQRVDIPRYYVPLTAAGWAYYRAGIHRGLANRLPESLVEKVRELRAAWYRRKFQAVTGPV